MSPVSSGAVFTRKIGIRQKIKNIIGDLLGYGRCYACGVTLWREDYGFYLPGEYVCSKCKYSLEVVKNNLTRLYESSKGLTTVTENCPFCRKRTTFSFVRRVKRVSYEVNAVCKSCCKVIFIKEEWKPEVKEYIEKQKLKMKALKHKVEELGIEVRGDFFQYWDYSDVYMANFDWSFWNDARRMAMNVDEVLKYVKLLKDDITYVQLGSEGHYSVCNHWVFVLFKDGLKVAINVRPFFWEDLLRVAKGGGNGRVC